VQVEFALLYDDEKSHQQKSEQFIEFNPHTIPPASRQDRWMLF